MGFGRDIDLSVELGTSKHTYIDLQLSASYIIGARASWDWQPGTKKTPPVVNRLGRF